MKVIESERLYFRYLTEADATQVYADWLNDSDVNRYLETRHSPQTIETCKAFIAQCNADQDSHLLGIYFKETGQHIGNVKLGFINRNYQRGQLSLFIGERSYWGKGLSTELVRAVTRYAFESLGLHRIEAGCYEDNLGSLRVFLKAGYTVEGFLRNHVVVDGKRSGCFWLSVLRHEYL